MATLGGSVQHIVVTDLQNDTFYAKISISRNGGSMEVDARPSDAIALAVRAKVPIYVEEGVLEKAGIVLDKETGKPLLEGEAGGASGATAREIGEEDIQRMSAFKDFIEGLNLEDLDRGTS
jgi:hypothetical protein